MKVDEKVWEAVQQHLKYSDEEMKLFKENPRNSEVISKGLELMNKVFVAKVIESHGCNSQHNVGEKFYFDGAGNLLSELSPKKVCIYALHAFTPSVFAANELFLAGIDPNEMRFRRAGCFDVGVKCGGFGRIIMEFGMEDRQPQESST